MNYLLKIIKKSSIFSLFIVVMLVTTLFAITYAGLVGSYETLSQAVAGENKNTLLIYSRTASTPFTSLIPLDLMNKLSSVEGIKITEPEIIVPSLLGDEAVFLRGVDTIKFPELVKFRVVDGEWIDELDINSVVVGSRLASHLSIAKGDIIFLRPALSNAVVLLQIKGVIETGTPLDDEVIATLETARVIRGLGGNVVTLLRVRYDPSQLDLGNLYAALGIKEEGVPSLLTRLFDERVLIRLGYEVGEADLSAPKEFMDRYLSQYGMTYNGITVLAITIFILTSYIVAVTADTLVKQHENELGILKGIGTAERKLKICLILLTVPVAVLSAVVGIYLGNDILRLFTDPYGFKIMTYTLVAEFASETLIASVTVVAIATIAGLIIAKVRVPT
jgi:ABC-type lipoprotein release transport system permease subunit